jgi:non-specific serine/threonine protein kinase/serine/threonine-protein kinase
MTSDDWRQVRDVFGVAMTLEGPARGDCLAGLTAEVRAEVESLLIAHDSAGQFLEADFDAIADDTRIGPYHVIRKIGEGGMGAVYLADRDGESVALKLIPALLSTTEMNRRFLAERYILASLMHPNIVRLMDSGEWEQRYYFAMEYVAGAPITDHCSELSLRQKLEMFRSLASAVHYAHQNLIVHRDLKPANILVTADGVVKVLDFGIAKLLDAGAASPATTRLHPMSLDCASPEQVKGQPVTTASDIYSLGVLLYEILTGVSPQAGSGRTLDETVRCICETAPSRPSALDRSIPADLDSIVLRALQKEPRLRYHSAEELSADIERFLNGAPVMAREATLGYVARKFVARHKAAVAGAAAVTLLVTAASGAAFWQSRVAARERTIAQRRFEETRKLARSVIFDMQGQLAKLPGTLPIRRQMIAQTLTYLESMARDAAGNSDLLLDIAGSYSRVAEIQGAVGSSNLGDTAGAAQSMKTSLRLLDPLLTRNPPVPEALRMAAEVHEHMGTLDGWQGRKAERSAHYERAAVLARRYHDAAPASPVASEALAVALFYRALGTDGGASTIRAFEESLDASDAILRANPASPTAARNVALSCKYLSNALMEQSENQRALEYSLRAQALDAARLAKAPEDRSVIVDVSNDLASVGRIQFELGRYSDAIPILRRNLELRERLAKQDPADALMPERIARAHQALGMALQAAGNLSEAQAEHRASLALMRLQLARTQAPKLEEVVAADQLALGEIARLQRNPQEACRLFVEAHATLQRLYPLGSKLKVVQRELDQASRNAATCK